MGISYFIFGITFYCLKTWKIIILSQYLKNKSLIYGTSQYIVIRNKGKKLQCGQQLHMHWLYDVGDKKIKIYIRQLTEIMASINMSLKACKLPPNFAAEPQKSCQGIPLLFPDVLKWRLQNFRKKQQQHEEQTNKQANKHK